MLLPRARGPISAGLIDYLFGGTMPQAGDIAPGRNVLVDDDWQLALWVLNELHYRGFEGVPDESEWDPIVLAARRRLETAHELALRAEAGGIADCAPPDVPAALNRVVRLSDGPSLSSYLQRRATVEEFREFVVHRSVYHLKEADPHAWGIPRLAGPAKAALVEIEYDEYGSGRAERMHAELFRELMRALGLDDAYGHYVDEVPGCTLAVSNTISLFGLHRRLRGALAGHLAAFEMTSALPNQAYSRGVQRLGLGAAAARFFDEHVEADAVHEQIAAHDLCGSLARTEPGLTADIIFGARAALAVEREFAQHLLSRWTQARSSLHQLHRARNSDQLSA